MTTVWTLAYDTRFGTDITVYASEAAAQDAIADIVDSYWDEAVNRGADPNTPADERVDAYFDAMEDEDYRIEEDEIQGEPRPETVVITELPREGRIPCPRDDCDGYIVEIDIGCRINRLEAQEADTENGVEVLVYAYTGDADFYTDRFACNICDRTAIMPDDFAIEDWS